MIYLKSQMQVSWELSIERRLKEYMIATLIGMSRVKVCEVNNMYRILWQMIFKNNLTIFKIYTPLKLVHVR